MSGADTPRQTDYWRRAVIAARSVIEDSGLLGRADTDKLAEAVTEKLLGDFLWMAEASSSVMFTEDGRGPFCSWCGKMPGLRLAPGHPQAGLFCGCKRDPLLDLAEGAA